MFLFSSCFPSRRRGHRLKNKYVKTLKIVRDRESEEYFIGKDKKLKSFETKKTVPKVVQLQVLNSLIEDFMGDQNIPQEKLKFLTCILDSIEGPTVKTENFMITKNSDSKSSTFKIESKSVNEKSSSPVSMLAVNPHLLPPSEPYGFPDTLPRTAVGMFDQLNIGKKLVAKFQFAVLNHASILLQDLGLSLPTKDITIGKIEDRPSPAEVTGQKNRTRRSPSKPKKSSSNQVKSIPVSYRGKPLFEIHLTKKSDGAVDVSNTIFDEAAKTDIAEKVEFAEQQKRILGVGENGVRDAVVSTIKQNAQIRHLNGNLQSLALYHEALKQLDWMESQYDSDTAKSIQLSESSLIADGALKARLDARSDSDRFKTHVEKLKKELQDKFTGPDQGIKPSTVSQIVYRASVLSVKPAFRGTFSLLNNKKLRDDNSFLTDTKFQELINKNKSFQGRKSLVDDSFELRAVSYNQDLNDTEIMVAMACDTYLTGVLIPGQHIYADGHISYGDSLNLHDHAHRYDVTLDYFNNCAKLKKKKKSGKNKDPFPYIKPNQTTKKGKSSFYGYFDEFRAVVNKKLLHLKDSKKKQYLKELNFMMFFHCHEPLAMGRDNNYASGVPYLELDSHNCSKSVYKKYMKVSSRRINSNKREILHQSKMQIYMTKNHSKDFAAAALVRFMDKNDAAGLIMALEDKLEFPKALDDSQDVKSDAELEIRQQELLKRKLRAEVLTRCFLESGKTDSTRKLKTFKQKVKPKNKRRQQFPDPFADCEGVRWCAEFSDEELSKVFEYMQKVHGKLKSVHQNRLEGLAQDNVRFRRFVKFQPRGLTNLHNSSTA